MRETAKNRDVDIDVVRFMAILAVIAIHGYLPPHVLKSPKNGVAWAICRTTIGGSIES